MSRERSSATWAGVLLPSARPTGVRLAHVAVARIVANPRQPRQVFDPDSLAELTESIDRIGLLQPLVVRPVGQWPDERFELVAGERRLRCVTALGWEEVPVVVRPTEDADLLRDALLENLHRADLNPLEEAAAYAQLLEDFGCTHDELAARIGRSRPHISNMIRLLRLPAGIQRRVAAGVLSQGHARALLALPDVSAMEALAGRIVAEGLSVRAVEEIVAVGEADRPRPPRRRAEAPEDPGIDEVAAGLADRLDTRVRVTMGRTKGRVTIEFAGRDDLDRILELLGVDGTAI